MAQFCSDLQNLNAHQDALVTSIREYERDELTGEKLREAFVEDYSPAQIFAEEILVLPVIYRRLRDYLRENGVTILPHRNRRITSSLAVTLFEEEDQRAALSLVQRTSGANGNQESNSGKNAPSASRLAHNMSVRFRESSSKFSGAITENWSEYLDEYQHACQDYELSQAQKLQYMYHMIKGDAKRFYNEKIRDSTANFSDACRIMYDEYHSFTRQTRIKNHLTSLRVSNMVSQTCSIMDALEKVHQTICKLYLQAPAAYRNETHKTEYLRHAVIGMTWSKEPLSRLASMNLSYQEFYSQLEASIQQEREEKKFVAVDKANAHISGQEATDIAGLKKAIPGVLFATQAHDRKNITSATNTGRKTCFKCGSDKHLIRQCPENGDIMESAAQKVQTYNRFSQNQDNSKRVLYELCQQLEGAVQPRAEDNFETADIFFGDVHLEKSRTEGSGHDSDGEIPIIVDGLYNSVSETADTAGSTVLNAIF